MKKTIAGVFILASSMAFTNAVLASSADIKEIKYQIVNDTNSELYVYSIVSSGMTPQELKETLAPQAQGEYKFAVNQDTSHQKDIDLNITSAYSSNANSVAVHNLVGTKYAFSCYNYGNLTTAPCAVRIEGTTQEVVIRVSQLPQ